MRHCASFEIEFFQFLDENARAANDLPGFARSNATLLDLYRSMSRVRALDARAIALQRTGKLGTYPSSLGQEAIGVGAGSCVVDGDVVVPYYRSTGLLLERGIRGHEILLCWGGDERGNDFKDPRAAQDMPFAIPIASQTLHAAGVAAAFKFRGQDGRAVLTEIGEGGTSEGEFYEAMNVAGAWNLPLVCIINNNKWAISVPSEIQTNAETFAQKGIAAGIDCVQVDGNDVIGVKYAAEEALKRARSGGGPTLIEAVTYRLGDHTTADDATRYNDPEVHREAERKEPVARLAKYLTKRGAVKNGDLEAIHAETKAEIDEEVKIYLDIRENQPQPVSAMFDHLFENLPERVAAQRDEALAASVH